MQTQTFVFPTKVEWSRFDTNTDSDLPLQKLSNVFSGHEVPEDTVRSSIHYLLQNPADVRKERLARRILLSLRAAAIFKEGKYHFPQSEEVLNERLIHENSHSLRYIDPCTYQRMIEHFSGKRLTGEKLREHVRYILEERGHHLKTLSKSRRCFLAVQKMAHSKTSER